MKLPKVPYTNSASRFIQTTFGTLDETSSCRDGGIADMSDICGDDYPYLSARKKRSVFFPYDSKQKFLGGGYSGKFYCVMNDGNESHFYYGGVLKGSWSDTEATQKQFAVINRYICVFPDAVYYRMEDTEGIKEYKLTHDCETIYSDDTAYAGNPNSIKLGGYTGYTNDDGYIWLRHAIYKIHFPGKTGDELIGETVNLFAYNESANYMSSKYGIPTTLPVKIIGYENGTGAANGFHILDIAVYSIFDTSIASGVLIPMQFNHWKRAVPEEYFEKFGYLKKRINIDTCKYENRTSPIHLLYKKPSEFDFNGAKHLCIKKNNAEDFGYFRGSSINMYPDLCGTVSAKITDVGVRLPNDEIKGCGELVITIEKNKDLVYSDFPVNTEGINAYGIDISINTNIPELDLVCAKNNRLYGMDKHTLKVCALGDPFKWNDFSGTAADSYAVDLPVGLKYTAIIPYNSYINIFCPDRVIKLYGDTPAEFQTVEMQLFGVSEGATNSVCIINGVCYYKGDTGLFAYTGSQPTEISAKIRPEFKGNVNACTDGRYWYISGSQKGLYVFDTRNGGFFKDTAVCEKCGFLYGFSASDSAYAISDNCITLLSGDDNAGLRGLTEFNYTAEESDIHPCICFGDFYCGTFDKKRLTKLIIRIKGDEGCRVDISIAYDGKGFERAESVILEKRGITRAIPIIPNRCDRYALKIEADRGFTLEGIAQEVR